MMERLMQRAEAIARRAQAERLEQIARTLGGGGLEPDVRGGSVSVRGRRLAQQWLADPLLRFAGRSRA